MVSAAYVRKLISLALILSISALLYSPQSRAGYETPSPQSCLEKVILAGEDTRFRAVQVSSSPSFWIALLNGELAQSGETFASGKFKERGLDFLLRSALDDAPHDSIVLDCGANIGFVALTAASLGFGAIAFEPIRVHREKIHASICLNSFSRLKIIPKGLSNRTTILRPVGLAEATQLRDISYDECVRRTSNSHLRQDAASDEGNCREELPITTLDEELTQLEVEHVRFMKLDIEGHEVHALHGARKLLESASLKFIHFEWSPSMIRATSANPLEIFPFLRSFRFNCVLEKDVKKTEGDFFIDDPKVLLDMVPSKANVFCHRS
jgi:FkbM family methyltransferase